MKIFSFRPVGWLIFLLLWACGGQPARQVTHCWYVSAVAYEPASRLAAYPDFNQPRSFREGYLRFYDDQRAAIWHNAFGYSLHRWTHDPETDTYRLENPATGGSLLFRITRREGPNARFSLLDARRNEAGVNLVVHMSRHYEDEETDLLEPEMNRWRQRPARRETKAELKKRVWQMVNYGAAYFAQVERRKQTTFETRILQSPFRFFSGGIGLTTRKKMPPAWVETFYDRQDAEQAYGILLEAFYASIKYPRGSPTHTAAYLKVLESIRGQLE